MKKKISIIIASLLICAAFMLLWNMKDGVAEDASSLPKIENITVEEFEQACKSGSTQAVKDLLTQKNVSPNSVFPNGEILLRVAVKVAPNSEIIKTLLELGADANLERDDGRTALTAAVDGPPLDVAQTLIDAGADVNAKNKKTGVTALMFASKQCKPEVIRLLLDKGADITATDKEGKTVLMWASINGDPDGMKLLLEAGADVNAKDQYGVTALMYAARNGFNPKIVKTLIEAGADVYAKAKDGTTALEDIVSALKSVIDTVAIVMAANYTELTESTLPYLDVVTILINAGADISGIDISEIKTMSGITPLIGVAGLNKPEYIHALVKIGADVNAKNEEGHTPLIIAVANDADLSIKALAEAGVNLNERDGNGWTLLMNLAEMDKTAAAKALIDAGADVNARNNGGVTALMIAAAHDKPTMVKTLIEGGANVNLRDNDGMTPLMIAAVSEKASGKPETLKALLKAGANINARDDKHGAPVLILAAAIGYHAEIISTLLEAGADPNLTDNRGGKAIDYVNSNENMDNRSRAFDLLYSAMHQQTEPTTPRRSTRKDDISQSEAGNYGSASAQQLEKLVAQGKVPAYVRDKGSFYYDPKMQMVIVTADNVRLRSQPNTQAKVIGRGDREMFGSIEYLGEWTHPNGEKWVVGLYDDWDNYPEQTPERDKKIVWIFGTYANPITMEQYQANKEEAMGDYWPD